MEKVSVVIPTYKRCESLTRAIESVLSQTYQNIEVLVVDDNGMDTEDGNRMAALLRRFSGEPRVRFLQSPTNVGSALARNIGIYAAGGEYIALLDDDDIFLPGKTEAQLSYMKEKGLDLCLVDLEDYNEREKCINVQRFPFPENSTWESMMVAHILHHLTATSTFMFKTEALRRIGGFTDEPAMHEYLLMIKAINAGLSIGHLPEVHTRMYAHSGERVSTGADKLQELPLLLESKKGFFHLLTGRQRRYIFCKHHGTIAFIRFTQKKFIRALWHLSLSFLYTPAGFLAHYKEKKGKFFHGNDSLPIKQQMINGE